MVEAEQYNDIKITKHNLQLLCLFYERMLCEEGLCVWEREDYSGCVGGSWKARLTKT